MRKPFEKVTSLNVLQDNSQWFPIGWELTKIKIEPQTHVCVCLRNDDNYLNQQWFRTLHGTSETYLFRSFKCTLDIFALITTPEEIVNFGCIYWIETMSFFSTRSLGRDVVVFMTVSGILLILVVCYEYPGIMVREWFTVNGNGVSRSGPMTERESNRRRQRDLTSAARAPDRSCATSSSSSSLCRCFSHNCYCPLYAYANIYT